MFVVTQTAIEKSNKNIRYKLDVLKKQMNN